MNPVRGDHPTAAELSGRIPLSYRLKKGEHVGVAVRRIGGEQSAKAIAELAETGEPARWRIHQLRKRCKKLRALVRLVRPGFDDYKAANVFFRDIARRVSDERDARVVADCVRNLDCTNGDDSAVIRWFALRCELAEELANPVLQKIYREMAEARVKIEHWDVADLEPRHVVAGVRKTLGRAHNELSNVDSDNSVRGYHELRKRSKYHWYHLRLLGNLMDSGNERRRGFALLADRLGDSHDRSVLLEHLHELPPFLKRDVNVRHIELTALRERRKLRRDALAVCPPLFDTSPDEFVRLHLPF